MFDVSWGEMLIVGAVALVVIGPKDLPRALRTIGQTVGKLKRMAGDFQTQFQDAMREVEVDELRRDVENAARIDPQPTIATPYVDPGTSFDVPAPELPAVDAPPSELASPLDLAPPVAETAPAKPARKRKPKPAASALDDQPPAQVAAPDMASDEVSEPESKPKPARKPRVRKAAALDAPITAPTTPAAPASEDQTP